MLTSKKIMVSSSQTMYDIALMYYGSVEYAVDIAQANGMAATNDVAGLELTLPNIVLRPADLKTKELMNMNIATKYPE